jgi:uncharacterized protein YneF (UPF0154 family)
MTVFARFGIWEILLIIVVVLILLAFFTLLAFITIRIVNREKRRHKNGG